MHQTSELLSAPLCTLLNHMELVPFLTLVCTALQNPSRSHGGCGRKGLSVGKQLCSQCEKRGRYPCELNPTISAATALRHHSAPSAPRCCSSVPTPSQERQNSPLVFGSSSFFSPPQRKTCQVCIFFPELFPLSNVKSICCTA